MDFIYTHLRNDALTIKALGIRTLYVKNISIIWQYLSVLFNFCNVYHYNLFSPSIDFLQCHKFVTNLVSKLIWKASIWWINVKSQKWNFSTYDSSFLNKMGVKIFNVFEKYFVTFFIAKKRYAMEAMST